MKRCRKQFQTDRFRSESTHKIQQKIMNKYKISFGGILPSPSCVIYYVKTQCSYVEIGFYLFEYFV